jgi:hypothetical protein
MVRTKNFNVVRHKFNFVGYNFNYIIPIIIVCIICGLLLWFWYKPSKVIPENKKTLKFKVKPSVFNENFDTELLFEPADIIHYNETALPLYEQLIFDFNELDNELPQVEIPNVDKQNVHDTTVNRYIRNAYNNIPQDENNNDFIEEIKEQITTKNSNKKKKILEVLNKIKDRNASITNLNNQSELSVLMNVWNQAKTNENIKNELYNQLIDCIENDNVVCPTGVVNRLTTALLIETPEKMPKTKEIINNEILQTASQVRNELEDDEDYQALSSKSQNLEFKNALMDIIEKEYEGIHTKEELAELIKDWIDYV